jgi:hypothetical protein
VKEVEKSAKEEEKVEEVIDYTLMGVTLKSKTL